MEEINTPPLAVPSEQYSDGLKAGIAEMKADKLTRFGRSSKVDESTAKGLIDLLRSEDGPAVMLEIYDEHDDVRQDFDSSLKVVLGRGLDNLVDRALVRQARRRRSGLHSSDA